jgi:hypothetical protein
MFYINLSPDPSPTGEGEFRRIIIHYLNYNQLSNLFDKIPLWG